LTYDTKVLSQEAGPFSKTDLGYIYKKVLEDKKFYNNLMVEVDTGADGLFSSYEKEEGQAHDAGYDSYMTGVAFAYIAKFYERISVLPEEAKKSRSKRKQLLPDKESQSSGKPGSGNISGR